MSLSLKKQQVAVPTYNIEQNDSLALALNTSISYRLSFARANNHQVEVSLTIAKDLLTQLLGSPLNKSDPGTFQVFLPVWVPGSYMVRDFTQNISQLKAVAHGTSTLQELPLKHTSKNTWQFEDAFLSNPKIKEVVLSYSYFAHEMTVRQSFVCTEFANLNPANFCMTISGLEHEPVLIEIDKNTCPHHYQKVSTALTPLAQKKQSGSSTAKKNVRSFQYTYVAQNYDTLIDSPMMLGAHEVHLFKIDHQQFELAFQGLETHKTYFTAELMAQIKKILQAQQKMFGGFLFDRYVLMISSLSERMGGLEHARSSLNYVTDPTTTELSRWYEDLLGLVSHEFFHNWNVKRIRPAELGPFNYHQENYTHFLWFCEGATSYYDDFMCYRAGLYDLTIYLRNLGTVIDSYLEAPSSKIENLCNSSFTAWDKYYKASENLPNRIMSYYRTGAMICFFLDLQIIRATEGKKNLDDFFRALQKSHQKRPQLGYSEKEFFTELAQVANIKVAQQLQKWVTQNRPLSLSEIREQLSTFGLELSPEKWSASPTAKPNLKLGFTLQEAKGALYIQQINQGTAAEKGGLSLHDEVIALNDWRIKSLTDWNNALKNSLPSGNGNNGSVKLSKPWRAQITVGRNQQVLTQKLTYEQLNTPYILHVGSNLSTEQKKWLGHWHKRD